MCLQEINMEYNFTVQPSGFFALHINDGVDETSSFSLIVTKERARWPF